MISLLVYIFFIIPIFIFRTYIFQFFFVFLLIKFFIVSLEEFYRNLRYSMGTDILSFSLISLRLLITIIIISSRKIIYISLYKLHFTICCHFLCLLIILVFRVLNFMFIYIYFELRLVPLIILILG